MTFSEAKNVRMPFGAHIGMALDAIAADDAGLKYLDWLLGEGRLYGTLKEAVLAYLSDPSIKKELENLR